MEQRRRPKRHRSGDCTLQWRGGEAVACIHDPRTNKRQRIKLGRFKKNSQEARDALDRFAENHRAMRKHAATHKVGELWAMWLAERAQDGFRNDIYEAQWVSLKPAFANRLPLLLTAQDFRDYARARFDRGRSAWTVHNELVRIRTCLKWAFENNHVERRVKVWVPKPGKSRKRVLSFDEARALVAAAMQGDPHIYLFVVLAFATGARHTAILDLTWDRVDFIEGVIEFDENLPPDPMNRSWKKGRATVPMNRVARAALERAYQGRQTHHVIEHGARRLKTVRLGFHNAVTRAGLAGDVTPHTIRHTVITWLDQAAIPTGRTAQLAGHKDERTTRQVYTHASHAVLRPAVEMLDDAFAPMPRIGLAEVVAPSAGGKTRRVSSRKDKSPDALAEGDLE